MSIIFPVSPASSAAIYQVADAGNSGVATPQNLTGLAAALEGGDLSLAQSALAGLSVSGNVVAESDYASMVGAVDAGNFSAAEAALSNLQIALDTSGASPAGVGLGHIISSAYAPYTPPTPPGHQLEITV